MANLLREYTMICLYCSAIILGFCGIALFGYGCIYILQGGIYIDYFHYPYAKYPIIAGVVFAIVAALTYFVTIASRNILIGLSTVLLIGLVCAQILLSAKGLKILFNGELDKDLRKYVLSIYGNNDYLDIEHNLKCCGFDGPGDYHNQSFIHKSCCEENGSNHCTAEDAFPDGCYEIYYQKIAANIKTSSGLSIGAAILGFISVIANILYMILNNTEVIEPKPKPK